MFGRGRRRKDRRQDRETPPVPAGVDGTPFDAWTLEQLHEAAEHHVWAGYLDDEEILDLLVERVEHDPESENAFAADRDASLLVIRTILAQHVTGHAQAAAGFPTPTDLERLDTVFADLERDGVLVGRQVGVTHGDLTLELWDRLRETPDAHGWIGFHEQDVDRAIATGVLYLSFAHRSDQDADFVLVAQDVAQRLRDAGFEVVWDGSADARLELRGVRWQRRRG